ncbi:MAG TPA: PspA/IM30 family protein [Acidimicrobiales bacterium]|nr:PspA/IM30 family protein [Acidimicrobiales bacterium]
MANLITRWWRYFSASANSRFNERADPKIQLEQAISEAQQQHRRLTEQAANVIANQKQAEMRLNRSMEELGKVNNSARQAVLMADEATKKGDTTRAAELTQAAQAFANRLVATEREVDSLKTLSLQSAQAADQAKQAVVQNSAALQTKLTERQKLLSQLDQAKMQEQMNRAMSSLSQSVGQDVPTLDEVRDKIEARYARALGASELGSQSVESRMLEVEQAQINTEAQDRLDQIREQLGLPAAGEQASLGGGSSAALGTAAAADTKDDAAAAAPGTSPETPAPANPPGEGTK